MQPVYTEEWSYIIVHLWLEPVLKSITECEDLQQLTKLRELLKATVEGLMENGSMQNSSLIKYALEMMEDGEKQLEKEKEEKRVREEEAGIWVTEASSQRTTSDGRAQLMVEEEVKLTGVDRNEKERKRVNKNSKEELMGFRITSPIGWFISLIVTESRY